eukprot:TRINITY_DN14776_c0_g1_i1.p1 TRINITY_DN14776_c0_g1~~TRINITY_DN14776_c0_g1_i1.p1  ORF type:complete len:738 (+),score=176.32 TRINITY_DN14776_c0_g1_i1:83-2296(+)
MDSVSSKDILGFFLDWLRQHQLTKTEKCLLEEIEYVAPAASANAASGAMDEESCNSESCDTNENDVDLQVLPEKDDSSFQVEDVAEADYSPEKIASVLAMDISGAHAATNPAAQPIVPHPPQNAVPVHAHAHAAPYKAVAASHHPYHGLPQQQAQPLSRPVLPIMEEDEDDWDPDDLGFIRVPAQPGDEIYRIIDHDDPSRAAYPYLQPGIEEENYYQPPPGALHGLQPGMPGYHPPQYQQHYAQFSSVPYYAVAAQGSGDSAAQGDAAVATGGENLGGRTSPESRPDSATGSGSPEEPSEQTDAAEALATKLELSASQSVEVVGATDLPSPSYENQSEAPSAQTYAPSPALEAEKTAKEPPHHVDPRSYPIEVEEYPSQPTYHPPGKPPVFFDSFELKVVYQANRTGFEEHKDFPIRMHSIIAGRYQVLEFLGSAAFSRAIQCVDLKTGQLVCIKIIRNNKDFFDQSLDEIKLLQYINTAGDADENCVLQLYDYFYHKEHLFLVCELLRDNLYEFSKYNRESGDEPYFTLARLQKITRQVLTALKYIHRLNLMHCDLKPENILIKSYSRCEVKVIDFGSSCFTSDHLSSYVQSRCYRAPEVVLGLPYGQKIDLWSLGGILAELYSGRVLFHNDSINAMIARIVAICGNFPPHLLRQARYTHKFFTPRGVLYDRDRQTGQIFYLYPKQTTLHRRIGTNDGPFLDFINCLLQLDPEKRPTAEEALRHPFLFHDYGPIS